MVARSTSRSRYTQKQIDQLKEASPLDFEKCKIFAALWNVSAKSVQAKVISEGLEYQTQIREPATGTHKKTKADFVRMTERALKIKLQGLEGASHSSLGKLARKVVEVTS
jgi:hypothetical protein